MYINHIKNKNAKRDVKIKEGKYDLVFGNQYNVYLEDDKVPED